MLECNSSQLIASGGWGWRTGTDEKMTQRDTTLKEAGPWEFDHALMSIGNTNWTSWGFGGQMVGQRCKRNGTHV